MTDKNYIELPRNEQTDEEMRAALRADAEDGEVVKTSADHYHTTGPDPDVNLLDPDIYGEVPMPDSFDPSSIDRRSRDDDAQENRPEMTEGRRTDPHALVFTVTEVGVSTEFDLWNPNYQVGLFVDENGEVGSVWAGLYNIDATVQTMDLSPSFEDARAPEMTEPLILPVTDFSDGFGWLDRSFCDGSRCSYYCTFYGDDRRVVGCPITNAKEADTGYSITEAETPESTIWTVGQETIEEPLGLETAIFWAGGDEFDLVIETEVFFPFPEVGQVRVVAVADGMDHYMVGTVDPVDNLTHYAETEHRLREVE